MRAGADGTVMRNACRLKDGQCYGNEYELPSLTPRLNVSNASEISVCGRPVSLSAPANPKP